MNHFFFLIEKNQEFSLFFRFIEPIQFIRIFHSYFFYQKSFIKILRLPNLEYTTFKQFIVFKKIKLANTNPTETLLVNFDNKVPIRR